MYFSSRKALVAAVLSCALAAAFANPVSADSKSDLEKKKQGVSGDINGAKKDLEASSKAYGAAVSALKRAQTSLDAAQNHLGDTRGQLAVAEAKDIQMQAELNRNEAALAKAKIELAAGKKSLASSEEVVKRFTLESLEEGDRGLQAFSDLLQGASPTSFNDRINLNNSVGDAQLATMQHLDASKIILGLNRDKVKKLRDQVAVKRAQSAANLITRKHLESQAETQADEVSQLVSARSKAKKSANSAKKSDEAQLAQLESERNRLAAQLRALAAKEKGNGGSDAGGDGGGTLSRPASGPITSPYGMRFHPVLHVWKLHDGTDFGVPCGTPVKAAASGTIIQEYFNGGYGNRVILNNGLMRGQSVVTTYNHLSRFVARVGQHVNRGQVIAYSGTTGYSTGCHLHFMVIVNGATVNPMGWL
ncbi:MAG: peptidoglycan DD-metalloendopeptidase family protein [Aeromicrobium sp.]